MTDSAFNAVHSQIPVPSICCMNYCTRGQDQRALSYHRGRCRWFPHTHPQTGLGDEALALLAKSCRPRSLARLIAGLSAVRCARTAGTS